MNIKILLADDHQIIRQGLRLLLDAQSDMTVVGEAGNGREAVRLARELSPDVVIVDVAMPVLNGHEATRQILAANDRIKVVALSIHGERRVIIEMLRAGASGYLLKESAAEELVDAIRTVIAGKQYLSLETTGIVIDELRSPDQPADGLKPLTVREREIAQLLTEGMSARQIAETLSLSVRTVETHRFNIMSKLEMHDLASLTKWAIREGITFVDK